MSDDHLRSDDPRVLRSERGFIDLDKWLSLLEELQQDPKVRFDAWLVACLLKSGRRAYVHLRGGWQTDSSYVAWGCRNLLELRVFARYVARSPADRKRFTDDMTVDTSQSAKAIIAMAEREVPGASSSDEEIVLLLQTTQRLKSASGFDGNKYLSIAELAKEMKLDEELSIHKVCSKLVHPSAQSILLIDHELQAERDALFLYGGRYLIDLMYDLIPFIETLQHESQQQ